MSPLLDPTRALLLAILPVLGACGREESEACMTVADDATSCPAADDIDRSDLSAGCGSTILRITGEGELMAGSLGYLDTGEEGQICCYPVIQTEQTCAYGRPMLVEGQPQLATLCEDPGWAAGARRPRTDALAAADRQALAARWTAAALDEHAAVAAFNRVSLELLMHGAPMELVRDTQQAAIDEVRHARLGFALASAYQGAAVGPGGMPLPSALRLEADPVALAVAAFREGCIGETVSAMLAGEASLRASDPAAAAALRTIHRDEVRHAALGWRTARFYLERGGEAARLAMLEQLDAVRRDGVTVPMLVDGGDVAVLQAHGLLDRETTRRLVAEVVERVILPCATQLLREVGAKASRSGVESWEEAGASA
jgi:hypothetical protein